MENSVRSSLTKLREMEAEASGDSFLHRLHPLSKLTVTLVYIAALSSFSRYQLTGMIPFLLYPLILSALSDISLSRGLYRLRFVLPLLLAVGIFNPILDRTPLLQIGTLSISGGMISLVTLMLKGILSLLAAYLLTVTTDVFALCRSLRQIHVPELLVTLFLLTMRYIHVLSREAAVMTDAYLLRAPGQRGIRIDAWGSFLGELLIRSIDRAQEIYAGMQLRGYNGALPFADQRPFAPVDRVYTVCLCVLILLCRLVPVTQLIGGLAL